MPGNRPIRQKNIMMLSTRQLLLYKYPVKYPYVAGFAVLIYDYFITLDLEIKYLLNTRWSLTKFLFLLCRYSVFADTLMLLYYELGSKLSSKACLNMFWATSWLIVAGMCFAESILVLRTYALWNRDKRILCILLATFTAGVIISFVSLNAFLRPLNFGLVLGCTITSGAHKKVLLVVFSVLLLLETVILSLTIYVGIKRFRRSTNPILITLYRDGIMYFVFSLLFSLGNIITLAVLPLALFDILIHIQRVMHSIFSTRLILHLQSTDSSTASGARHPLLARGHLFWRQSEHPEGVEVRLTEVAGKL